MTADAALRPSFASTASTGAGRCEARCSLEVESGTSGARRKLRPYGTISAHVHMHVPGPLALATP